jgi:hypothetical protein
VSSDGCTFMPLKLFIKIPNTFERWEFSIAAESFELIPNTCCIRERAEKSLPLCCRIATPATCHLFSAKPLQRQVGPENCNREIEACAELFQMQLRIARGRPVDPFDAERAAFEPRLLHFKRFCMAQGLSCSASRRANCGATLCEPFAISTRLFDSSATGQSIAPRAGFVGIACSKRTSGRIPGVKRLALQPPALSPAGDNRWAVCVPRQKRESGHA